MKKVIGIIIMILSVITLSASAEISANEKIVDEIQPRYQLISSNTCSLAISGTTATCESTIKGLTGTKSITAIQTLEKHWAFGIFKLVDNNSSWTKTINSISLSMTNSKSGLSSGTYRVKTEFTVTSTNGQTETVTVYSDEKTILQKIKTKLEVLYENITQ